MFSIKILDKIWILNYSSKDQTGNSGATGKTKNQKSVCDFVHGLLIA